jgi:hypothetical protein
MKRSNIPQLESWSSNIVIVPRDSRVDYLMKHHNLSQDEVISYLRRNGLEKSEIRLIFESHARQGVNLRRLKHRFCNAKILSREDLTKERLFEKTIIAAGGDNHFQHVVGFVDKQTVVGVNLDPETSAGSLTPFTWETLNSANYDPKMASWTRLIVSVKYPGAAWYDLSTPVLSEVYFGEAERHIMSRVKIAGAGVVKSSGILVYTGSGSSGWAKTLTSGYTIPRAKRLAHWVATERFSNETSAEINYLKPGRNFSVISLNDHRGVIWLDSNRSYPFPEGTRARVRLGRHLSVIVPKTVDKTVIEDV